MPGIGIVTNPHSRHNRRFPEKMRRLGYILGQNDHYELTNSIDEIRTVAEKFKEHNIDILGLNGGDGTNNVTLSTFIDVYGETPLPKIAFLKGGTMNNICNSLGIKGSPSQLLANLVEKYYTEQPFQTTHCDIIKVSNDQGYKYGFIFGNGIVSNYLDIYYSTGNPSPLTAAYVLGRAIVELPFGGKTIKQIVQPFRATTSICNNDQEITWPSSTYTAILAATVQQIGLGFRPLIRANEQIGSFHILGFKSSAFRIIQQLPKVRFGFPIAEDVAYSEVATKATISSDKPISYTIDGELYTSNSLLTLSMGPTIEVIIR